MTHEIESWIEEAARSAGLLVERQPQAIAADIERRARSQFVVGNPRVWWMSLSRKCEQFDSTHHALSDVLPDKAGRCWLIAETGSESLPVYSLELPHLLALLGKCPYFEYYVLGSDLRWFVAESDHNLYFVCQVGQ
jgi:hypothetical protein